MNADPDEEISEEERLAAIARLKKWVIRIGGALIIVCFAAVVIWTEFLPKYRFNSKVRNYEATMAALKSDRLWTDHETKAATRLAIGTNLGEYVWDPTPEKKNEWLQVGLGTKHKTTVWRAIEDTSAAKEGRCVFDLYSDLVAKPKASSYVGQMDIDSATLSSMEVRVSIAAESFYEHRTLRAIAPGEAQANYLEWREAQRTSSTSTPAASVIPAPVHASAAGAVPPAALPVMRETSTVTADNSFGLKDAKNYITSYFHYSSSGGDAAKAMDFLPRKGTVWYYGDDLEWTAIKRGSDTWDAKNPVRVYSIPDSSFRIKQYSDGFYAAFQLNSQIGQSAASTQPMVRKCYIKIEPRGGSHYITKIALCSEKEDRPFPGWVIAQYKTRISRRDIMLEKGGIVWNLKPQGEAVVAREIVLQDRLNYFNDIRDQDDEPCPWFSPEGASSMASLLQLRRKQLELMGTYFIGDKNRMFNGAADVEVQVKYQDRMTVRIVEESDPE